MTRIIAGEGKIGAARRLKRLERGRLAGLICGFHQFGKDIIALQRAFGDQVFAAFEMPIDGCGGDTRLFRRL